MKGNVNLIHEKTLPIERAICTDYCSPILVFLPACRLDMEHNCNLLQTRNSQHKISDTRPSSGCVHENIFTRFPWVLSGLRRYSSVTKANCRHSPTGDAYSFATNRALDPRL